MPNVAGREFPYTPQGMAAAEQYKQSLGMRGGGMMGFRPVGYRDGDLVEDVRNFGRIQGGVGPSDQDLMETSPRVGEAPGLYGTAGPDEAGPVGGVMAGPVGLPEAIGNLGRLSGAEVGGAAGAGVASDVMAIFQGLVDVTRSGSVQDVAAYIEANRQDLNDMVSMMMLPPGQADFLRNTLSSFPSLTQPQGMPQGMPRPPGRRHGGIMSLRRR